MRPTLPVTLAGQATGVGTLQRQELQRLPLHLPAFDGLRGHPPFATLLEVVRKHAVREHAELLQLRAAGVIRDRGYSVVLPIRSRNGAKP